MRVRGHYSRGFSILKSESVCIVKDIIRHLTDRKLKFSPHTQTHVGAATVQR